MSVEENKMNVRRIVDEVMNGGDISVVDELIAPDYVYHGPDGDSYHGPEGVKQYFNILHTAFPDIRNTIEDIIAEGDKVVLRYTARGTHNGTFMGIPPTSKKVTIPGMNIARFKNGKQVELWQSYNTLSILQQLGLAPAMAQAVK